VTVGRAGCIVRFSARTSRNVRTINQTSLNVRTIYKREGGRGGVLPPSPQPQNHTVVFLGKWLAFGKAPHFNRFNANHMARKMF
jgi:hypothetical protein